MLSQAVDYISVLESLKASFGHYNFVSPPISSIWRWCYNHVKRITDYLSHQDSLTTASHVM